MSKQITQLAMSAMLLVTPLIALADDDDNVPLDPAQLAQTRNTLLAILGLVAVGVGLYLFRRWQTIRSGNSTNGSYGKDD